MLKLIGLEMKKNKMGGYLRGTLIANAAIMAFLTLVYFADRSEGGVSFGTYDIAFALIENFVRVTFIVFSAVVMANIVIDEYKSKTITLMFMYPIKRQKIIASKLIIVFGFAFLSMMFSNLLISSVLYTVDHFYNIVPDTLTLAKASQQLGKLSIHSFAAAGISLIPLFFGMLKKSVPATIVSSIIIVSVISSGFDDFRLGDMVGISLIMGAIGILIAYLSIRNLELKDV